MNSQNQALGLMVTIDEGNMGDYYNRNILPYIITVNRGMEQVFTWSNIVDAIYIIWNQRYYNSESDFIDDVIGLVEEAHHVTLDTNPDLLMHVSNVISSYYSTLKVAIGSDVVDGYHNSILLTSGRGPALLEHKL